MRRRLENMLPGGTITRLSEVRSKVSGPEPERSEPLGPVHNIHGPESVPQRIRARGSGSSPVRARTPLTFYEYYIRKKSNYNHLRQNQY